MLAQLVRPILASEEASLMHMSMPLLFGIVGTLLIVAIYFVWGRKSSKQ
jgi:hypothetical protein